MKTHHTTVSGGTQRDAKEYVSRVVEKTLRKQGFPSETVSDSMAIEVKTYRPNNLRRQMRFDSGQLTTIKGFRRKGKLRFLWKDRVTVQAGSRTLTAIWDQRLNGKKEVFRFKGTAAQNVAGIEERRGIIRERLDAELLGVCAENGLTPQEIVWERCEEGIKGDVFLDSLPRDLILHDTVFKKVYRGETEFLTGKGCNPVFVKNYLNNRAVEAVAPEIASELRLLREDLGGGPLRRVMDRVRVFPDDLLRPDVQALVSGLLPLEKEWLSAWFVEVFYVHPEDGLEESLGRRCQGGGYVRRKGF